MQTQTPTQTVTALHYVDLNVVKVHHRDCRDVARALTRADRTGDLVEPLGLFDVDLRDPDTVLRDAIAETADPDNLGYRDLLEIRYQGCLR